MPGSYLRTEGVPNTRRRATARERGYDAIWDRQRAEHLRLHPLCVMCAREGKKVRASTVDHKTPHRGDRRLLRDPANLQSLCTPHHSRTKQRIECRGYSDEIGIDGLPVDPAHPFNAAEC